MELSEIRKFEEIAGKFSEEFVTDSVGLPEAKFLFNRNVPEEPFLNYATDITTPKDIPQFVRQAEKIFAEHKAKPNFALSPYTTPNLKSYLIDHGYEENANTAWMFFDPANEVPEKPDEVEIRLVENEQQFREFAKVMVEVFSKGEPDDPYHGFSPKWGEVLLKQYNHHNDSYQLETYLAYINGELAGGAQLLFDNETGYLDWLSVLPKFRRLGVGKALQATRVNRAKKLGVENIFLLTEVGSRNEKIFTKFGFKTEFATQDLIKN